MKILNLKNICMHQNYKIKLTHRSHGNYTVKMNIPLIQYCKERQRNTEIPCSKKKEKKRFYPNLKNFERHLYSETS